MDKKILTIDPGLNTGIALHENDKIFTSIIFTNKGTKTVESKISSLYLSMNKLFCWPKMEIQLVIIEGVQGWQSSVSMAAATRGNLSLLSYIVGAYYSLFACKLGIPTIIIDPTKWKGQLTETALREWVFRATGTIYDNPHILSAVGIGVLTKGKLW